MKSQYNLTILIVLLFFTNSFGIKQIKAQSQKNKIEINYNDDNQKHYIKTINFVNPVTKKNINTFEIHEHNPYENLDFPELEEKNHQENKAYIINNIKIKDFKVKEGKFNYRKDIPDTTRILDGFASSYNAVFFSDTAHIIILYELYLYQGYSFLGVSSKVIILSNEGELIHQLKFFDTQCLSPTVTKNGRYFAYGYGGSMDEDFSHLDGVGFAIYDLQKSEIVVDEKVDKFFYNATPYNYNNLIRINCKSYEDRTYIIYDFESQKIYRNTYPVDQIGLIKEVTDLGFVVEEGFWGSGRFRIDYYKEVFEEEDIK